MSSRLCSFTSAGSRMSSRLCSFTSAGSRMSPRLRSFAPAGSPRHHAYAHSCRPIVACRSRLRSFTTAGSRMSPPSPSPLVHAGRYPHGAHAHTRSRRPVAACHPRRPLRSFTLARSQRSPHWLSPARFRKGRICPFVACRSRLRSFTTAGSRMSHPSPSPPIHAGR
jgi:hypothetical protein